MIALPTPKEKIEAVFAPAQVFMCAHLETGEVNRPRRIIDAGPNRKMVLCHYCSGALVEKVLEDTLRIRDFPVARGA